MGKTTHDTPEMQSTEAQPAEIHPIDLLSPGTVRAVGLALDISRQLAYQRLQNLDDEAWAHAKRIEEERKAKRKEMAAEIRAIQSSTSTTTPMPQSQV